MTENPYQSPQADDTPLKIKRSPLWADVLVIGFVAAITAASNVFVLQDMLGLTYAQAGIGLIGAFLFFFIVPTAVHVQRKSSHSKSTDEEDA